MSLTLVRSLGTSTGVNGGATNGGGNIYTLTFPTPPANGNALFFTVFASAALTSVVLGSDTLTPDYSDTANGLYFYSKAMVSGSPTTLVVTGSAYTINDVSYDEVTPSGTVAYVGRTAVSAGYNSTHSVPFTTSSSDAFVRSSIKYGSSETVSGVTAGWDYGRMMGGAGAENAAFFTKQASVAAGSYSFGFTIGGNSISGDVLEYSITASGPTVTSVTQTSGGTEGSPAVMTVALSGATSGSTNYAATLVGVTATGSGTDFTSDLASASYSNGVTFSGGNMVVPDAVSGWTVTIATTGDTLDEANETATLTVGGTAGTLTITDDDAAPTITGTASSTVTAGDPVVITYSPGLSGQTRTYTLALTDGTAVGGTDYDNTTVTGDFAVTAGTGSVSISGSTVTVDAGVTEFTLSIGTTA